jgi:hypothetical protein
VTQIVDCIDNLEALPAMDAGSIDAIVTDPPYGLAFMNKNWDKALPDRRTWSELLRVLKPGGHAVIFGAPRLYHRLAVDVEDAGFEIRDCLMWLFGSGFPKSLDVSKAIDAAAGAVRTEVLSTRKLTGTARIIGGLSSASAGRSDEMYQTHKLRDTLEIMAPATPEAAAWSGWGTALKPAYEPILLCRKPLDGTVAHNVLTHGTGAINVNGCRIASSEALVRPAIHRYENVALGKGLGAGRQEEPPGRWPANLILDDDGPEEWRRYFYCAKASRSEREAGLVADSGRANTHPTVKPVALMRWLVRLVTSKGGLVLDPFCGSGSTGVACVHEGVRFLGLELDAGYAEIARARIAHAKGPLLR